MDPTTGCVLQILTEELDAGRVIYRSLAATSVFSVTKNRAGYFWKSTAFVTRKLRDLYEEGPGSLCDPSASASGPQAYSRRLYGTPKNRDLAPYLGRLVARYARQKIRDYTELNQWSLAYRFARTNVQGVVPDMTPFRFHEITPPRDRFWADPFPMRVDGRYHVLFEELEFKKPKGRICGLEIGPDGPVGEPVRVLDLPYHVSYPYTFEWQGDRFMIPESVANRTVELYRAVRAPYEWKLDRVLLRDVSLVDASVVEIEGLWWMFAGAVARGGSRGDELNLYYADSPLGPWHPHRRNPVLSDVRHSRPAGRPFEIDGRWYRPAQDCSNRYGYAISLQRIVRLNPGEYQDETITRLTPDWNERAIATHTINAIDGLTVISVQMRRRSLGLRNGR